ncbi:TRAP transporter small permease [Lampropedia puyangensis]|uniref:TRAP transporter small permease protein n=1 Tax=Lampropedia puyangensis TaxID=1330072 RepID=A0A4S8FBY0_9BURK|nr:TRAP transporter small permease [Lampropedia puyangensis]THU04054.1 TRAP transporter small permease [Lampropedia puyangensis]
MKYLEKLATFLAGFTLFVLVAITIGGVVMRYFFNSPWHWTEEMSGLLMVWIVFLGMAVAERQETNLTISFITDSLKPKLSALVNLIMCVLSVVLLAYMAWLGYKLAGTSQFRLTQILKVSWYWVYLAVPLGAGLTVLFTLPQIKRHVCTLLGKEGSAP